MKGVTVPRAAGILFAFLLVFFLGGAPGAAAAPPQNNPVILDVRGADLRDVLSALAQKMGVSVILGAEPKQVTFQASDSDPKHLFEMVIKSCGLTYLQSGSVIAVDTPDNLRKNFFSQMPVASFDLFFVPADKFKSFLESLEAPVKVAVVDSNPHVVWVQGTAEALRKVGEIVNTVDIPDNQQALEYRALTPTQVTPVRAVEILKMMGVELNRYVVLEDKVLVFDRGMFAWWDELEKKFREIDTLGARKFVSFRYALQNISAKDAAERLKEFDFGEGVVVKVLPPNNAELAREVVVICPPAVRPAVQEALSNLDGLRSNIRVPIEVAEGKYAHQELVEKRLLLSELSGVSVGSMHISTDISGGRREGDESKPRYVLWVETTPDKAQQLRELLNRMKQQ